MRPVSLLLPAACLLATLAPSVLGQSAPPAGWVTVTGIDVGADGRLRPETEIAQGEIVAHVQWRAPAACLTDIDVRYSWRDVPSYANVAFDATQQTYTLEAGRDSLDVKNLFSVSTTRQAPAFQDYAYSVEVEFLPGSAQDGCLLEPARFIANFILKNDYVPALEVGEPAVEHEGATGWVHLPVKNLGNGPTRVDVQFHPERAEDFQFLQAQPIFLESGVSGREAASSGRLAISYMLNGVERATFTAQVLASHDSLASEVDETFVELVAVADPVPEETNTTQAPAGPLDDDAAALPAPALPLLAVGLAASVFVARRKGSS